MALFMLLLYDHADDRATWLELTETEREAAIGEYVEWTKKPFVIASQRLGEDAGRLMSEEDGEIQVLDGPFVETKELLGGYYTIKADDYDHAVQRAGDHPHLQHGTIVIRHVYGT